MKARTICEIDGIFVIIASILLSVEYGWLTGVAIGLLVQASRTITEE